MFIIIANLLKQIFHNIYINRTNRLHLINYQLFKQIKMFKTRVIFSTKKGETHQIK